MKILHLPLITMLAIAMLAVAIPAIAADEKEAQGNAQSVTTNQSPQMSEIPKMKEQGKRMAELMQKIQEVKDPAERKRMLAEATCPQ